MEPKLYESILKELKDNKETNILIETVLFDRERETGFLARMVKVVIEQTYERGFRDGRVTSSPPPR